jgi:hypothetical protein
MPESKIKDVSPDDIYFMTWLIECIEYDDIGNPYMPMFHETITQDYYIPEADYVLNQKANDENLINKIDRLWALADYDRPDEYRSLSGYLKELAFKYVYKRCVRNGKNNIHTYFEEWIDHTFSLVLDENGRLYFLVFNFDIDNLVKEFGKNLKLYTKVIYKPKSDSPAEMVRIRLKDFFANEQQIHNSNKENKISLDEIHLPNKYEIFMKELNPYKFTELEKVKNLNVKQIEKLIKIIVEYDVASAVAMLYFLELPNKLSKEFRLTKEKQYSIVSRSLNFSQRAVKGNFLTVSNSNSKEDQYKYPARDKLEIVEKEYEQIRNS